MPNSAEIKNNIVTNIAVGQAHGYITCPDDCAIGWHYDPAKKTFSPPPASPPTATDVDAARDRRIAGGFSHGGKRYQSRPDDLANITGAALLAQVSGGKAGNYRWHGGTTDFTWITAGNRLVRLDAPAMIGLGRAALAHKRALIYAARALKDKLGKPNPPADVTDDKHWP